MLKIGSIQSERKVDSVISKTQKLLLEKAQILSEIVYFDTEKEMFNALNGGEIAVVPYPMAQLPTQLPQGIVVTAVSEREKPSYSLVALKNNIDENQMLSLIPNAQVLVADEITRAQFQTFRDDIKVSVLNATPSVLLAQLTEKKADAIVLPTEILADYHIIESEYYIISFNPKELIPAPATGVIAFLVAADDTATRRQLKNIHNPSVSALTNIERRLKQLFSDKPIAAYCEIDRAYNYHFLAAAVINDELKKCRLSQSTSYELAEKSFENLQ